LYYLCIVQRDDHSATGDAEHPPVNNLQLPFPTQVSEQSSQTNGMPAHQAVDLPNTEEPCMGIVARRSVICQESPGPSDVRDEPFCGFCGIFKTIRNLMSYFW